jgi:hypothetical protein
VRDEQPLDVGPPRPVKVVVAGNVHRARVHRAVPCSFRSFARPTEPCAVVMARDSAGSAKRTGEYDPRSARAVDCGEIGLEERELQGSRLSSSSRSSSSRRQQPDTVQRLSAQRCTKGFTVPSDLRCGGLQRSSGLQRSRSSISCDALGRPSSDHPRAHLRRSAPRGHLCVHDDEVHGPLRRAPLWAATSNACMLQQPASARS